MQTEHALLLTDTAAQLGNSDFREGTIDVGGITAQPEVSR